MDSKASRKTNNTVERVTKKSKHNVVEKRSRAVRKNIMDTLSSNYSKKCLSDLIPYDFSDNNSNTTRALNENETIIDLLSKSKLLIACLLKEKQFKIKKVNNVISKVNENSNFTN